MKDISSWRPGVLLAGMCICLPFQVQSLALAAAGPRAKAEAESKRPSQGDRIAAAKPVPTTSTAAPDREARRKAMEERRRQYRARHLCLGGTDTVSGVLETLYAEFRKTHPDGPRKILYEGGGNTVGLRELCAGRVEAALIKNEPTEAQQKQLSRAFPDAARKPAEQVFAKAVLVFVVHPTHDVAALEPGQIEDIYRGKTADWSQLEARAGKVARLGTTYPAISWGIFTRRILKGRTLRSQDRVPFRVEGYTLEEYSRLRRELAATQPKHPGGGAFPRYRQDAKVVQEVAKNLNAIGYCLLPSGGQPLKGVRVIQIIPGEGEKPVAPTRENLLFDKYPLQLTVKFLISPNASQVARDFIKFACSEQAAPIISRCGLIGASEKLGILRSRRLALMKAGKGVAIRGVGSMGGSAVMRDLAVEYVKAEKVVQMACRPATSELTAVGYFVNAKDRELLVLDGPISEQAMKLHGKKWDFLEPETHVLASGRGIAICVNSMNKLGSLTLEQVRHLFSKKTSTWRDVTGAEVKIKRYGLVGTDPAARVFYNRINPPAACARAETRQGTQGVLAALSRDPHGIAFVDAAAANDLLAAAPGKSGIKVLSIGAKGKAAPPTAANVKAGKYPIAQRLTLHVSPRASQTTRDFVKFILSGAADDVFTKHGLTPAPRPKPAEAPQKPAAKKSGKPAPKKSTPAKPRKPTPKKKP